jgi:DNA primase
MARIPQGEIERLKREVSLARLVEAKGVALARHGADLVGRCPFHEDRTPSLVVSPKKNLWHCLGACQAGGSVIDWVMKTEGLSFRHAVEVLRDGAPSIVAGRIVKRSTVPRLPAPVSLGADDRELLGQVVDYYHATLKASPEALRYLERRGLAHPELVERFRLGFANRTLGVRLPVKNRKTGAVLRERLQAIGVLRGTGHEHFSGCLVVPVVDEAGQVTEVYGRKITEGLKPGIPLHLYLPGPHRGVWNEPALAVAKEVILCEALIDAMSFWCAGYRNVTSAYGVEAPCYPPRADRLRSGRRGRARRGETCPQTHRRRDRVLAHPVPQGDGRERVRAQGAACGQGARHRDQEGAVAWQGARARARADRTGGAPAGCSDRRCRDAGARSRACAFFFSC